MISLSLLSFLLTLGSSPCDPHRDPGMLLPLTPQSASPIAIPRPRPSAPFLPPSLRPEGLHFRSRRPPSFSVPRDLCIAAWSIGLLLIGLSDWRREPQADGRTEVWSPRFRGAGHVALWLEPEGLLWVSARIFTLPEPWETPSTPFSFW